MLYSRYISLNNFQHENCCIKYRTTNKIIITGTLNDAEHFGHRCGFSSA